MIIDRNESRVDGGKKKMRKIYIRAWFGDWYEVSFEKACEFFKNLMERGTSMIGLNVTFPKHFKGVSYEEILEHNKR